MPRKLSPQIHTSTLEVFDEANQPIGVFDTRLVLRHGLIHRRVAAIIKTKKNKILLRKNRHGQFDFCCHAPVLWQGSSLETASRLIADDFDEMPHSTQILAEILPSGDNGFAHTKIFEFIYAETAVQRVLVDDKYFLFDNNEFKDFCFFYPDNLTVLLRGIVRETALHRPLIDKN